MNKLVAFFLVVCLLLFGGCVDNVPQGGSSLPGLSNLGGMQVDLCNVTTEEMIIDSCYTMKALDDVSFCGKALHVEDCYFEVAKRLEDPSLCGKIWSPDCEEEKSYMDCIYPRYLSHYCYASLASITHNVSLCDFYHANVSCAASVLNDISMCEGRVSNDTCHSIFALLQGNASVCAYLPDVFDSANPDLSYQPRPFALFPPVGMKTCYAAVAWSEKEPSYCNQSALDKDHRNRCVEYVVKHQFMDALISNSVEECDKIGFDPHPSDDLCYHTFEGAFYEMIFCTSYKNACYHHFAILNRDPLICDRISLKDDYSTLADCYTTIALLRDDPSLCERMPSDDGERNQEQSDCYTDFAILRKDKGFCDKITWNNFDRWDCYALLGRDTGDVSLCEQILEEADEVKATRTFWKQDNETLQKLYEKCRSTQ